MSHLTIEQASRAYLIAKRVNTESQRAWEEATTTATRLASIAQQTEQAEAQTRQQLLAVVEASGLTDIRRPNFRVITDVTETTYSVQEATPEGWVTRFDTNQVDEARKFYELALMNGGWSIVVKQAESNDRYGFTTDVKDRRG